MVNFARIFDRRVAHIGLLCCALAFLLRTKFPHPLTIFGVLGRLFWMVNFASRLSHKCSHMHSMLR